MLCSLYLLSTSRMHCKIVCNALSPQQAVLRKLGWELVHTAGLPAVMQVASSASPSYHQVCSLGSLYADSYDNGPLVKAKMAYGLRACAQALIPCMVQPFQLAYQCASLQLMCAVALALRQGCWCGTVTALLRCRLRQMQRQVQVRSQLISRCYTPRPCVPHSCAFPSSMDTQ